MLLTMLACTRVNGEVGGGEPRASTGFFIEDDEAFGSDGLVVLYLNGAGTDCEGMDLLLDALDDADSEAEKADEWAEALPEEFWEVLVFIRVRDTDSSAEGELEVLEVDESLDEDGQAEVIVREYEDWPEADDFAFSDYLGFIWPPVLSDSFFDTWSGDGASEAEISAHSPGESISGRIDGLQVVEPDGDFDGELDLRFSLERCRSVEDWFFP